MLVSAGVRLLADNLGLRQAQNSECSGVARLSDASRRNRKCGRRTEAGEAQAADRSLHLTLLELKFGRLFLTLWPVVSWRHLRLSGHEAARTPRTWTLRPKASKGLRNHKGRPISAVTVARATICLIGHRPVARSWVRTAGLDPDSTRRSFVRWTSVQEICASSIGAFKFSFLRRYQSMRTILIECVISKGTRSAKRQKRYRRTHVRNDHANRERNRVH